MKIRREQERENGSAPTGLDFWRLSLSVLYGLEKTIYARGTPRLAGSEARREGKKRGNLLDTILNLLSPRGLLGYEGEGAR